MRVQIPSIVVEGPKIANLDKKRRLVQAFTQAAVEASDLPRETIVVILHETHPECVARGGELKDLMLIHAGRKFIEELPAQK